LSNISRASPGTPTWSKTRRVFPFSADSEYWPLGQRVLRHAWTIRLPGTSSMFRPSMIPPLVVKGAVGLVRGDPAAAPAGLLVARGRCGRRQPGERALRAAGRRHEVFVTHERLSPETRKEHLDGWTGCLAGLGEELAA
jgi:hypothetical protein